MKLGLVMLAAGEGSRLGGAAKALLPIGDTTFLGRILDLARAANLVDAVIVVGPPHGTVVALQAQQLGMRVVVNEEPKRGMASSVALGFAAIAEGDAEAAWLWPVDHPSVELTTLEQLLAALGTHAVARPQFEGRGGHPPLIARGMVSACQLRGAAEGAHRARRARCRDGGGRGSRRGAGCRHALARQGVVMRTVMFGVLLLLVGCPAPRVTQQPQLADSIPISETNLVAALIADLQDEVLQAYDRDEPPQVDTSVIDPKIGPARIGVGPGDLLIANELERAPSRWPLFVDRAMSTEVRSKNLSITLAPDRTAGWVSDEISWRIGVCGRTAIIPLRFTALYARDHDRWVQVFEHLSFARPPTATEQLVGKEIVSAFSSGDLRDELSGVLSQGLFRASNRNASVLAHDAVVIGPDVADEWRGPDVMRARLASGKLEERRVGPVGANPGKATVAYWIGNYIADVPARPGFAAGKVRMRVSFVFQNRRQVKVQPGAKNKYEADKAPESKSCERGDEDCHWMLEQAHVSTPILDADLASAIFGTALLTQNFGAGEPLRATCEDGSRITAPAELPARSGKAAGTR
ncbi:MAG: NTP transferase domain-containing protein [Kofleriaceae bacterium]